MTELEILQDSFQRIEKRENWTQLVSARDSSGNEVPSTSIRAVCWCSTGSIFKTLKENNIHLLNGFDVLEDLFEPFLEKEDLNEFNDDHSHEEVITLWMKVITRLKKEENNAELLPTN
jgi:hypothetical protein